MSKEDIPIIPVNNNREFLFSGNYPLCDFRQESPPACVE
jgi:hypothetical protein